jgi:hypothetical protein
MEFHTEAAVEQVGASVGHHGPESVGARVKMLRH